MKFIFSILFASLLCNSSMAQSNLVLNPSFEQSYDTCFPSIGGIAAGQVDFWSSPNNSTSDYFVPLSWDGFGCSYEGSFTSPPINPFGFEYAHNGECYCGFGFLDATLSNDYEYVQGSFAHPLIAGQKYAIESFVSLGEPYPSCLSNLGFFFTDTLVSVSNSSSRLLYTPQFENDTNHLITEHNGWQRITGSYMAHGGERFVSIGNFNPYNMCHVVKCVSGLDPGQAAYLFIDDVAVYDTAKIDSIKLCMNDSVRLGGIWLHTEGLYFDTIAGLPVKFYVSLRPESASLTVVDKPFVLGDSVRLGSFWVKNDTIIEVPKHNIYGCDSLVRYRCRTNLGIGNSLFAQMQWSIYPNPTNDFIEIQLSNNDMASYDIVILDITGNEIISQSISNSPIDISLLSNGMYFIKLLNSKTGKVVGNEKFVKE